MPRAGSRRRTSPSQETRQRLVGAAAALLATRGYAAATARAIGEEADCNQALVFYHYGSLNDLLLAALDASSQERLDRYRETISRARSVKGLREAVGRLYEEDRRTGHVTLLAELVAGGVTDRELGRAVAKRVEPWIDLAADAIRQVLPTTALRRRLPVQQLAYAVVALFLGMEILGQLAGDHGRGDAVVQRLAKAGLWPPGAEARTP